MRTHCLHCKINPASFCSVECAELEAKTNTLIAFQLLNARIIELESQLADATVRVTAPDSDFRQT